MSSVQNGIGLQMTFYEYYFKSVAMKMNIMPKCIMLKVKHTFSVSLNQKTK